MNILILRSHMTVPRLYKGSSYSAYIWYIFNLRPSHLQAGNQSDVQPAQQDSRNSKIHEIQDPQNF